jgi:hypothetical protein
MKKIILIITFLSFFISTTSYSQSSLPKCKGDDRANFHNCFGEFMFFKSKYVGEFQNELPNGQGTMNYDNGVKYTGQFKEGFPDGQGTAIYPNGDKYTGEWKKNFMDGQGTYTTKDGKVKSGIWSENKLAPHKLRTKPRQN